MPNPHQLNTSGESIGHIAASKCTLMHSSFGILLAVASGFVLESTEWEKAVGEKK